MIGVAASAAADRLRDHDNAVGSQGSTITPQKSAITPQKSAMAPQPMITWNSLPDIFTDNVSFSMLKSKVQNFYLENIRKY